MPAIDLRTVRVELNMSGLRDMEISENNAYIRSQLAAKLKIEPLMIQEWERKDRAGTRGAVFEVLVKSPDHVTDSISYSAEALEIHQRQEAASDWERRRLEQLQTAAREAEAEARQRALVNYMQPDPPSQYNWAYSNTNVHSASRMSSLPPEIAYSNYYVTTDHTNPPSEPEKPKSTVTLVTRKQRAVSVE